LSYSQISGSGNVITSDLDNFWRAYDLVIEESDSTLQMSIMDSIYIQNRSAGLEKIMEVRRYTASEYVRMINHYPKFLNSLRSNTYKAKDFANDLNAGIDKLEALYPDLKPASIYFTIGCLRTNGTTRDSMVLIGSELAMADEDIDISEFTGIDHDWLETYFSSNPIDGLVLLNIHEYVHTQQSSMSSNLLYITLYEGIAEFVSCTAMKQESNAPAINYGKNNPAVREKFEREMFYNWTYDWLWSNSPNEFETRDLGYYIGYEIAERFYKMHSDKRKAIQHLIELDYSNPSIVDSLIDKTEFFSKPISELRMEDSLKRPKVIGIQEVQREDVIVDNELTTLTFSFSENLNGYHTGVDFSEYGIDAFPTIIDDHWLDSATWVLNVDLEPNTNYDFWITSSFRNSSGVALFPYHVKFKTSN
jgi:hypothetical protein